MPRYAPETGFVVCLHPGFPYILGMRYDLQVRFAIIKAIAVYVVDFSRSKVITMILQDRSMHEYGLG